MVTGHDYDGEATIVTAQDPRNPDSGTILMRFGSDPITLRDWLIVDATGGRTQVILSGLETGMDLPNSLFNSALALRGRDR
jgi:hypothetical protein